MNPFRPAVLGMEAYAPGEQPQDLRYIKLNTNENPYPPSPRVVDAVRASASDNMRLYPDPSAAGLRTAAAALHGLRPDQVLVGNGSDDLLAMLFRACIDPGDRIAYPVPTYSLYDTLVAIHSGTAIRPPFDDRYTLPAALAGAGARLTIICNPNSPSGTMTPLAELERLAGATEGLLVVDEAYVDFAAENAIPLLGRHDNVVVLRSLSKSYSLAGMRIGLALAASSVLAELAKVKDSYNVSRTSIAAGVAALEDQDWMRANAARIQATRARLSDRLRGLGYEVPESRANFVLARRRGVTQEPVYRALKARGILVRYFRSDGLADALRISIGTDAEIDTLLAALEAVLAAE